MRTARCDSAKRTHWHWRIKIISYTHTRHTQDVILLIFFPSLFPSSSFSSICPCNLEFGAVFFLSCAARSLDERNKIYRLDIVVHCRHNILHHTRAHTSKYSTSSTPCTQYIPIFIRCNHRAHRAHPPHIYMLITILVLEDSKRIQLLLLLLRLALNLLFFLLLPFFTRLIPSDRFLYSWCFFSWLRFSTPITNIHHIAWMNAKEQKKKEMQIVSA